MKRAAVTLGEARSFATQHNITVEQAARLLKRYRGDREKLENAAIILAGRPQKRFASQTKGLSQHSDGVGAAPCGSVSLE